MFSQATRLSSICYHQWHHITGHILYKIHNLIGRLNTNETTSRWVSCFRVVDTSGPFYYHGLTLIQAWISNYTHYKGWDEITYLFPNFSCATVEVWEWIIIFISHFAKYVITYPCWYTQFIPGRDGTTGAWNKQKVGQAFILLTRINLKPSIYISNHMPSKIWDKIAYPSRIPMATLLLVISSHIWLKLIRVNKRGSG